MKRKIGILGGTFDPIHVGHLILAERAYYQFGLEEVLIMPSGNPPHKKNRINRASLEVAEDDAGQIRGAAQGIPGGAHRNGASCH